MTTNGLKELKEQALICLATAAAIGLMLICCMVLDKYGLWPEWESPKLAPREVIIVGYE